MNILILNFWNIPFLPSSHSTRLLAATTLRNVLGTRNLAEILSERESISKVMQDALDEATDLWGVKVSVFLPSLPPSIPPWRCYFIETFLSHSGEFRDSEIVTNKLYKL